MDGWISNGLEVYRTRAAYRRIRVGVGGGHGPWSAEIRNALSLSLSSSMRESR